MKKLYVVCVILLTFIVLSSSLVFAQKPNFTGNWKMNKEKSDLGMYAEAIIDIKLKVEHEGVNFKTVSTSLVFSSVNCFAFEQFGHLQGTPASDAKQPLTAQNKRTADLIIIILFIITSSFFSNRYFLPSIISSIRLISSTQKSACSTNSSA